MHTSHLEALGPAVPAELSTAASALCEVAGSLIGTDETGAIAALELAARLGGADAALFVWVVPAQDEQAWFRSMAALDHRWGARVLRRLHEGPCCARRPNFDHPRRLNIDQGWKPVSMEASCG